MKEFSGKHTMLKYQLITLSVELLALILLFVLSFIYMGSGGSYWGLLVPIIAVAVLLVSGNIIGIRRMHGFMNAYADYAEFRHAVVPLINDMRSTQHDLANQLQVLRQAFTVDQVNPDITRFYETLDGNMKKLSMFLKTDKIIINALLAEKHAEAKEKKVDLAIKCMDRELKCAMDDFALTAVLSNLLQNAIETAPEGSAVHLELTSQEKCMVIKITNPGTLGVNNPDDIFRLGYSSKSENRGIGLFSVRRIVMGFKGRIEVEQDSGSVTFTVYLPEA